MNTQHDFKVSWSIVVRSWLMLLVCSALPACQLGIDENPAPGPIEEPRIREVNPPEDNRPPPAPVAEDEQSPAAEEPEPEAEDQGQTGGRWSSREEWANDGDGWHGHSHQQGWSTHSWQWQ